MSFLIHDCTSYILFGLNPYTQLLCTFLCNKPYNIRLVNYIEEKLYKNIWHPVSGESMFYYSTSFHFLLWWISSLFVCVSVFINHQILLIIIISQRVGWRTWHGHHIVHTKGAKVIIITTTKIHDDDDKAVTRQNMNWVLDQKTHSLNEHSYHPRESHS